MANLSESNQRRNHLWWLEQGLQGRSFLPVLLLYVVSLAVLVPVALLVRGMFGDAVAFKLLPILAVFLVAAQYAIWGLPQKLGRRVSRPGILSKEKMFEVASALSESEIVLAKAREWQKELRSQHMSLARQRAEVNTMLVETFQIKKRAQNIGRHNIVKRCDQVLGKINVLSRDMDQLILEFKTTEAELSEHIKRATLNRAELDQVMVAFRRAAQRVETKARETGALRQQIHSAKLAVAA